MAQHAPNLPFNNRPLVTLRSDKGEELLIRESTNEFLRWPAAFIASAMSWERTDPVLELTYHCAEGVNCFRDTAIIALPFREETCLFH